MWTYFLYGLLALVVIGFLIIWALCGIAGKASRETAKAYEKAIRERKEVTSDE